MEKKMEKKLQKNRKRKKNWNWNAENEMETNNWENEKKTKKKLWWYFDKLNRISLNGIRMCELSIIQ